jgi:RimJ/RimL family protein N-acetyltransferase
VNDDALNPFHVRAVRADEWARVKELRLRALRDPAAPLAFLETYDTAVGRPDSFWQDRAAGGPGVRQFVGVTRDGTWAGSVTALVEEAGSIDFMNRTVQERMGHLVGVFVLPEFRGSPLAGHLLSAAVGWCWSVEEPRLDRVRLFVHEDNVRARGAYAKLGFAPTGTTVPFSPDPASDELELAVSRRTAVLRNDGEGA